MRGVGADHEAKRYELVEAALRAVEQFGVDGLTFRRVAAEADVSLGRVQHYFTNRTDLVRATYAYVQELEAERITAELTTTSGRSVVEAVLQTLIPTSPSALAKLRVTQMFDTAAMNDAPMLRQLRTGHSQLLDFLAAQLDKARQDGEASASLDPSRAALTLLATAEGLSTLALMGHTPAPVALDLLSEQLELTLRGGS